VTLNSTRAKSGTTDFNPNIVTSFVRVSYSRTWRQASYEFESLNIGSNGMEVHVPTTRVGGYGRHRLEEMTDTD
jgi:hypothetical protein